MTWQSTSCRGAVHKFNLGTTDGRSMHGVPTALMAKGLIMIMSDDEVMHFPQSSTFVISAQFSPTASHCITVVVILSSSFHPTEHDGRIVRMQALHAGYFGGHVLLESKQYLIKFIIVTS